MLEQNGALVVDRCIREKPDEFQLHALCADVLTNIEDCEKAAKLISALDEYLRKHVSGKLCF